jgi:predicted nucleotidyltransferase
VATSIQKNEELLRLLADAQVDFVVIGGVAAIAHGSATFTKDFDVAAPLTLANVERLMSALAPYAPRYAMTIDKRRVTHTAEELTRFNNLYFLTDLGRIDILKVVEPIGPYETVAANAETIRLFERSVKVISLDDLIAVKTHVGRPKDKPVELELRAIRDKLRSGR